MSDATATVSFTDLDITAQTSANAKLAILNLSVHIDSYTSGFVKLSVRKNGETPSYTLGCFGIDLPECNNSNQVQGIVGLDSGEVLEYQFEISGTAQADAIIDVLGYIE